MKGYLQRLVQRAGGRSEGLRPRVPSLFEPPAVQESTTQAHGPRSIEAFRTNEPTHEAPPRQVTPGQFTSKPSIEPTIDDATRPRLGKLKTQPKAEQTGERVQIAMAPDRSPIRDDSSSKTYSDRKRSTVETPRSATLETPVGSSDGIRDMRTGVSLPTVPDISMPRSDEQIASDKTLQPADLARPMPPLRASPTVVVQPQPLQADADAAERDYVINQRKESTENVVHVTIGRLEIQAADQRSSRRAASRAAKPRNSLADYARRRREASE